MVILSKSVIFINSFLQFCSIVYAEHVKFLH